MECNICKEEIQLPHSLPCDDSFCYLCIKRHLRVRSYCPTCFLMPVNSSDLQCLIEKPKNMLPELKVPLKENKNESVIKRKLKKFQLSESGDYNRMIWRLKEYYLIYSAEKLKELPKSPSDIAKIVHKNENLFFKKGEDFDKEIMLKHLRELKEKIKQIK